MRKVLISLKRDLWQVCRVWIHVRAVLVATVILATAACGSYHFPSETPAGTGIVSGHVTVAACQPTEAPAQPCLVQPIAGTEIVFSSNGTTVTTKTDSEGAYSVELHEGTWQVSLKTYMRIIKGPSSVTVKAGEIVVANFVVDSGIRQPAPAA